jgi:diaminopimelate epimerase
MTVETGRGVLTLRCEVEAGRVQRVTVDMGEPILKLAEIPVDREFVSLSTEPHRYSLSVEHRPTFHEMQHYSVYEPLSDAIFDATFVSMGNPHVVIYVNDLAAMDVPYLGPLVENSKAFPNRINAHWVQVVSANEVRMRTWERGSGITLACGTGACAVCVAGVLTDRTNRKILAHLPGGDLTLEWRDADNHVHMTGPATEVFSGEWRET